MKTFRFLFSFFILCFFLTGCTHTIDREGTYYSDEEKSSKLFITRNEDGEMKAELGIFRLTTFSDMVVIKSGDSLICNETGEYARPVTFAISLKDMVTSVEVVSSEWELLPAGESFTFTKENQ